MNGAVFPVNYACLAQKAYAYETRSRGIGVYYTPLEVARRLVRDALAPLVYRPDGTPKTLEEILSLRILDPALGAGIFLLETCAQLTDFLARQGETSPEIPARIAASTYSRSVPSAWPQRAVWVW